MPSLAKQLHHTLPGFRLRVALRLWWSQHDFASPRALIEPYTMMPDARLVRLERSVRALITAGVEGDIVECGSARGGSAALMAVCLKRQKSDKKIHLFDTFDGLPEPTDDDPEHAAEWVGKCRGGLDEVQELFDSLEVRDRAVFVKGRFDETLAYHAPQRVALLHLDADWYESTKICLDVLWDKLVPGGIMQVDDYGTWDGCRKAVDEFFEARGITAAKHFIDSGAFWMTKA